MPVNKKLYQSSIENLKKKYYQDIKPGIDKVLTDPLKASLIGGVAGLVGSYLYKPDYDARSAKTQNEAYKMARSTGAKTFIWDGKKYNTDYKGDPNKSLVEQKQEELDKYGITNEQTQNKSRFIKNFLNTVSFRESYNYPIETAMYSLLNKKNKARKVEDKYLNKSTFLQEHTDANRLLLGYPQVNDTYKVSNYRPENAEHDYYLAYKKRNPITEKVGYAVDESVMRAKFRESHEMYPKTDYQEFSIKNLVDKPRDISGLKSGNNQMTNDTSMGRFTIGKTDNYYSYYDKWDLDPYGSGNDKPIIEIGKPLNIYDRKYIKK